MKAGWELTSLGKVCIFENGDRGKNYPGRKAFVPSGIPFINAGHIADGEIDWEGMNYIPEEHFERISRGKIERGDLLFCLRGSLGKFGHVTKPMRGAIASSLVIIRCKPDVSIQFLKYFLRSENCEEQIEKYGAGAAQPNLGATDLKKFQIPLPPPEEQKRIVAVLDAAFEGLTRARAHIETNLQNARELFRRSIESQFKILAATGTVKTIGDIATIKGGKRLPKGEKLKEEQTPFPYISIKDFNDQGSVDLAKIKYLSPSAREVIKNYIIGAEDLYISIAGTIGKTGIVPSELDGANLTENAARMIFVDGVNNEYVYHFTLTDDFQEQAGLNTRTAAQPKLALKRLKTITIPMVGEAQQLQAVKTFKGIGGNLKNVESLYRAKLQDLDDLRQSLLQKAFAGELT
ncbi:MAG: restriction endonuclease subunit S [Sulfitobacter sp.]